MNLEVVGKELSFKDRDGAEINFEDFPEIILQYKGCSGFYIEIYFDKKESLNRSSTLKNVS